MLYIITSFLSSVMYSSDVIFGKLALEEMPFYIFVFILSLLYAILGIILYLYNPHVINNYIKNKNNRKNIIYSIIAIILGTILADIFMWYSIKISSRKNLPITITIIHTAPILSLILVYFVYKEHIDYRAIIGIVISVIGCIIAILYSDLKKDII